MIRYYILRYIKNLLVGCVDIPFNALLGGSPYETLSERSWRWKQAGSKKGVVMVAIIDALFGKGHCASAQEGREGQYDLIDPSEQSTRSLQSFN